MMFSDVGSPAVEKVIQVPEDFRNAREALQAVILMTNLFGYDIVRTDVGTSGVMLVEKD